MLFTCDSEGMEILVVRKNFAEFWYRITHSSGVLLSIVNTNVAPLQYFSVSIVSHNRNFGVHRQFKII
jgi:hypothetical protein